jgi:hypothetical protein
MTKTNTTGNVIQLEQHKEREPMSSATVRPKWQPVVLQENTLMTSGLRSLSPRLKELVDMLEYARPEGSASEEEFIDRFLDTLPRMQRDEYGNRYCIVGKETPTVAWSSHTDTVHWDEGRQAIMLDEAGHMALDAYSEASCLGADCTAGVWLMRRMILAGKPGLYIFHRGEESGGKGSTWIAENTPDLVRSTQIMIALDRRGYDSVITEQMTGVTASKRFAASLAQQLGGRYAPDPTGTFTDSAFYSHLIPECSNLSVGYFDQHSENETLDYEFLDALLLALLRLDYGKLEVTRDHTVKAVRTARSYMSTASSYVPYADHDTDRHYQEQWGHDYETWSPGSDNELVDLIRRNPEACAMLMRQWDMTADDLYEAIRDYEEDAQ